MLALTGSGEYLPPMEAVDRELIRRLPGPARVVCLPTAAGTEGPERIGYWSQLGVAHFTRLGARVEALPIIDRTSANEPDLAAAILNANFVYLSGGKPSYLYDTLAGSRAWEAILSVLHSGGLLAGCSAGAMVQGEKFYGFPGLRNGFNFLPGATVVPHFDEISQAFLQPIRLAAGKKLTLLGIDGNTALVQSRSGAGVQYEVLGSGGVTVWNGNMKTRYTQGPMPGWESAPG
jgi:cyanophycinase